MLQLYVGCKILCFAITILLVVFIVISIVTLLVEIWIPLEPLPADKTPILNGSLILVKEIDSLFHRMAIVTLDVNFSHADDSINFYGVNRSCDDKNVIGRSKNIVLTKVNISNYVPEYYALEGSDFQYEISGNSTVNSVNVCAYRLSDYNKSSLGQCSAKLPLGQGSVRYKVPAPGYYLFRVEQSDEIADYKLSIKENLKILTTNQAELLGCSINSTNTECHFSLPLKPKYCLMAKLYQSIAISESVLVVQVKEGRFDIMLAIPLPLLVIPVLLFVLSLLCSVKLCTMCTT